MARQQSARSVTSLCAEVMAGIMEELAAGRRPWVQPWDGAAGMGLPCNAVTGERYGGINALILWEAVAIGGYSSQRWLTYADALALGGHVRKGEQGVTLCCAGQAGSFGCGDLELPLGDEAQRCAGMSFERVTVFNVEQCAALPMGFARDALALCRDVRPFPRVEALIMATGADVRIGDDAAYAPEADRIIMPEPQACADPADWYRLLIDRLCRWTGHASRLDRRAGAVDQGDAREQREALIAEIGGAFVRAELGIFPSLREGDQVGGCVRVTRDARAIFDAAQEAGRAADWLLGCLGERRGVEREAA